MKAEHYDWPGGREAMLRLGPDSGPVVIAALPPFEEANRTRAFVVTVLRALAERGIRGALPDLPGAGESLVETEHASLADWQTAFCFASNALDAPTHVFALRGGTLLDGAADVRSRYHLASLPGTHLVREMIRTRLAAEKEAGERFDPNAIAPPGPAVALAGNRLGRQLLVDLAAAAPASAGPVRVARLETDAQPADIKFAAAPLWRRAEPGNDPALAALVAEDIAGWIATCGE